MGLRAYRHGSRVKVSFTRFPLGAIETGLAWLHPKAQDKFIKIIKDLPPNAALRLLLGLDKRANAFLVWTHGDPQAVSPSGSDGSRMSGSFVEILPGVEKNEFGMFVDGYIIMLTADSWNKLKTSVIDRKDVSFSSDGSGLLKEFKIAFLERDYQNPVDGRGYYAEGVWQIYGSDADSKLKPKDAEKKIVEMNSLRLYLPDALLRQRLSDDVTSLARFVEALQREISVYWDKAGPPKAKGLIIAIGVKPNGKVRAWCEAVEGEIAADKLAELEKVLSQMPALAVKDGPIAIALQMSINGQIPAKFPEGPKVWADAAKQAREPLMIPDGLFKVIWPD